MKLNGFVYLFLILFMFPGSISLAQSAPSLTLDTLLNQRGDTLFISEHSKVFVNQKVVVGTATGSNGWYASIGFKSAFNWPTWLFKGAEERVNYDYEANPQHRINDKVKAYLHPGDTMTITQIKRNGNQHKGYWYTADLKSNQAFSPRYRCNLLYALDTKEIMPGQ